MKELVGDCQSCGKEIYCLDGFLNGVHSEDHQLLCFECYQTIEKGNPPSKSGNQAKVKAS